MAIINDFPYSNMHEINLDWLIKNMKDLQEKFGDGVTDLVREIVSNYFIDVAYSQADQMINLAATDGQEFTPTDNGHTATSFNVQDDQIWIRDADAQAKIAALDGVQFKALRDKKMILLGNSYARGTGGTIGKGWPYYFQEVTGCDATIIQQAGGDFAAKGNNNADYPNMTFDGAVTSFAAGLTQDQRDEYEYIVIGGGYNDTSTSLNPGGVADAQSGLSDLASTIRSQFPYAKVVFCPLYAEEQSNSPSVLQIYAMFARTAALQGWQTTDHSWQWFTGRTSYVYGDGIHLNDTGYRRCGRMMAAVVLGWDGMYSDAFSVTTETGVTGTIRGRIEGGKVLIRLQIDVENSVYNADQKHVKIFEMNYAYSTPGATLYLPCMYFNMADQSLRTPGYLEFRSSGEVWTVNSGQTAPASGGADSQIYFYGEFPNYMG